MAARQIVTMPERMSVGTILNKMIERVNANIRRLRVLEQEASSTKTRLTAVEEDLLGKKKSSADAAVQMQETVESLENRIISLETTQKEIINQLKKTTTSAKIKELEELMAVYNPLASQFTTKEEVERMIEERSASKK